MRSARAKKTVFNRLITSRTTHSTSLVLRSCPTAAHMASFTLTSPLEEDMIIPSQPTCVVPKQQDPLAPVSARGPFFRWKMHFQRTSCKLVCCWGLAFFFRRKSMLKKPVPRRTPRFEVFTPRRHQEITRAVSEAQRCGSGVMMSDDRTSDIYIYIRFLYT